jgi:flagellar biosynthesis/type III secretory pathway chaperone
VTITATNASATTPLNWEAEVSGLLGDLSEVQDELLSVLEEKRQRLAAVDLEGLAALQPREVALSQRLESCQHRRRDLLLAAEAQGVRADSIGKLAVIADGSMRGNLGKRVKEANAKMRLLQHQGLANWVLAQRSLLHVAQLLEIVATGGRMQPTYGNTDSVQARGSLVDSDA